MYAVIKTGGKQYRVSPGDVLVVEKLDAAEVGGAVTFDQVLMSGGGDGAVTLGAPLVEGATVTATLIETRKGEKIKVFKKIRRQGYRRTQGHRQPESVLRVTALDGAGASAKWDGTVDLTTRAELVARARGLAPRVTAQIMTLLRDLRDRTGLAVLLVEQNVRGALSVADEALVLALGRVVARGATADLRDDAELRHAYLGF